MVSQLRRAALSVYLNFAEGSSRKSAIERKRYYEIARGSVVEIDALFDIAVELGYLKKDDLKLLEEKTLSCFRLISLIKNKTSLIPIHPFTHSSTTIGSM